MRCKNRRLKSKANLLAREAFENEYFGTTIRIKYVSVRTSEVVSMPATEVLAPISSIHVSIRRY
jgi:hypothetical protein